MSNGKELPDGEPGGAPYTGGRKKKSYWVAFGVVLFVVIIAFVFGR